MGTVQHPEEDSITIYYRRATQAEQPEHFMVRVRLVLSQRTVEWSMNMPPDSTVRFSLDERQQLRLLATQYEFLVDSSGLERTFSLEVLEEDGE